MIAVVGKRLPPALRTFLLTLAVVDDLIAITIIAVFYTAGIAFLPLVLALLPLAVFAVLVGRGVRAWWLLIPLGVVAWALVHASGVHATIAGVALGLLVPAVATARAGVTHGGPDGHEERHPLTHHFAERWSPVSSGRRGAGVRVLLRRGRRRRRRRAASTSLSDSVAIGIIVALVVGKAVGITGASLLVTRLPGIRLDPSLRWLDVARPVLRRRHRLHRLAAGRGAGLRHRQRAGRRGQGRRARRVPDRRGSSGERSSPSRAGAPGHEHRAGSADVNDRAATARIAALSQGALRRSPALVALGIFLSVIVLFSALLALPVATSDGTRTPLHDSVFTAVSAMTVTGLVTVDTASHWSFFGQVVILAGIQVGGLGIVTIALLLSRAVTHKLGVRGGASWPSRASAPASSARSESLLKIVVLTTVIVEAALAPWCSCRRSSSARAPWRPGPGTGSSTPSRPSTTPGSSPTKAASSSSAPTRSSSCR